MASLVELIKFMASKGIYKTDTLPNFMKNILQKLQGFAAHRNIQLFLLRVILHCRDEFEPFAKDFTPVILSLISSEMFWKNSPMVNSFSLDLVVMLLSWNYIPDASISEKNTVTTYIGILAKVASETSQQREITRYVLDVVRLMTERWKSSFRLIYGSMPYKLFSIKEDLTRNNVGVQILGFFVIHGVSPYECATIPLETYFKDLAMNLECHKKEVYQATAEVLGLCLQYFKENSREDDLNCCMDVLLKYMGKLQSQPGAKAREKFVHCLYMCYQHFPDIALRFSSIFAYNLSQFSNGETLLFQATSIVSTTKYLKF